MSMLQAIDTHTRVASAVMPPVIDLMALPLAIGGPGSSDQTEPDLFAIYDLHDRETGLHYVGLTIRPLAERVAAHRTQARRGRSVRPGGLMARLREIQARGGQDPFTCRVVAHARTAAEARALERLWIDRLSARVPTGYNLMPGGSSVGPDGNARRVDVRGDDGQIRTHSSIRAAVADRNRQLRAQGLPLLGRSDVYSRLAAGWSPEEALGYQRHADGRGQRGAFRIDGTSYASLATAAAATGLGTDALRSRLHRARKRSPAEEVMDISADRRQQSRGHGAPLSLVWPITGEVLTAEQFARRAGIAKATVLHRWHRAEANAGAVPLTAAALHARLVAREDRRRPLELHLPDGRVWQGGEREVIRRLLGEPALEAGRIVRLSDNGIRRRLRQLSADQRLDLACTAWAFGFSDEAPQQAVEGQGTDAP